MDFHNAEWKHSIVICLGRHSWRIFGVFRLVQKENGVIHSAAICTCGSRGIRMIRGWIDVLVGVSVQFEKDIMDRRVERRQLEGLS